MAKQPPSGGCVLKLSIIRNGFTCRWQPPSGGCVLKQFFCAFRTAFWVQPPSGGCVLKLRPNNRTI